MRLRAARRAWLLGLVAVGGALFLLGMSIAQEPAPGVTFRSESALLELEVKVTAKGKKPVLGLRREDFSVFENGEPQEIAAFEYVPSIKLSAPQPMGPDGPEGKAKQPARAARPRPHTWMYVATHIGPHLRTRVAKAIREFVEEQMAPGVAVSLNGMPFVWDRDVLIAMLDGRAGPEGKRVSLVDVQSGTLYSEQFDASGAGTMFEGQDIPRSAGAGGLINLANIRRSLTARAALYRYIDLVRQMGRLPGKKVIVLYSQGLLVRNDIVATLQDSIEGELFDLYKRLSGEATRHRVSIYTVDARGLVATVVGGDSTYGSATAGAGPVSTSAGSLRMSQLGLQTVAELTGGKAVLNTNDLGEVFDKVEEDLGDYYVLAYYPKDKTAQGRERKIRVEVNRSKVKLSYRKRYYEDLAFVHMSKRERKRHLEQLVLSETAFTDLPLETAFHFYRGEDGKPVLAYNSAILPGSSWALPDDDSRKLHYTFVASVRDVKGKTKTIFDGLILERTFSTEEWDRLRVNPTPLLQFPSKIKLDAGEYIWKAIVRDERTGKVGTYRSRIVVPDFVGESSPSSLLLTQQVLGPETSPQRGRKAAKGDRAGAIAFGEMSLLLNPENVYPVGTSLFLLYDLYNVPRSFAAQPPAPRVFLVTGDKALENPPFQGFETRISSDRQDLRYVAALDTKDLGPGSYTLILRLPDGENALYREFQLDPRGDR